MKILKVVTQWAAVVGLSALLGSAAHALPIGSIAVTNAGPLGSFSTVTAAVNETGGMIERLTLDLSGTHCTDGGSCVLGEPLVFGGSGGGSFMTDPSGDGTSALFGAVGTTVFGFSFTGFDPLDNFSFSWDADVGSNGAYVATVSELAGIMITASVRFATGELVDYSGTMSVAGTDVVARLAPASVPEPGTFATLLACLGAIGVVGRRSRASTARS